MGELRPLVGLSQRITEDTLPPIQVSAQSVDRQSLISIQSSPQSAISEETVPSVDKEKLEAFSHHEPKMDSSGVQVTEALTSRYVSTRHVFALSLLFALGAL